MRALIATEHAEQVAVIQWVDAQMGAWPELRTLFAVPNGGDRNPAVAAKLKAEGVRRGVPDLVWLYPRANYHGLLLELKRRDGGRLSREQRDMCGALECFGYAVCICRGAQEAIDCIQWYRDFRGDR